MKLRLFPLDGNEIYLNEETVFAFNRQFLPLLVHLESVEFFRLNFTFVSNAQRNVRNLMEYSNVLAIYATLTCSKL